MRKEHRAELPPDDSPERGVDAESALEEEIQELEAIRKDAEEDSHDHVAR